MNKLTKTMGSFIKLIYQYPKSTCNWKVFKAVVVPGVLSHVAILMCQVWKQAR